MRSLSLLLAGLACSFAAPSIPDEDWGYVDVRTGAHMFWWLYGANSTARSSLPWIIWLQGGPGGSSTGFGNFEEIGPLDVNLKPRNSTWINVANVLFVDNPVGTGYSYVDDSQYLTTTNAQIAADLVTLTTAFVTKYPVFQTLPLVVASESYGGKMTVGFANALLAAMANSTVKLNFRGVSLGDSWISGIDYVDAWGPFLRATSLLTNHDFSVLQSTVSQCDKAVAAGNWNEATNQWGNVEGMVELLTDGVDFYNILIHNAADDTPSFFERESHSSSSSSSSSKSDPLADPFLGASVASPSMLRHGLNRTLSAAYLRATRGESLTPPSREFLRRRHLGRLLRDDLDALMNGPIRTKLGIIPSNVQWGGQSDDVFSALSGDFMRPVVADVDTLLAGNQIQVTVYNGQLDLICCTPGTESWMTKLQWSGMGSFYNTSKTPLYPTPGSSSTGAFVRSYGPLTMYYVLSAGHMAPADQPTMMLSLIQRIINGNK